MVARRAALLSGVAVATVLIQTDHATLKGEKTPNKGMNDRLGVGVDGRYRFFLHLPFVYGS